jgi:Domain of unknown function (DUF3560)
MNDYEKKQAAKKAKFERLAAVRLAEADSKVGKGLEVIGRIPPGQPILTDHYSARGHRRDLSKSDALMRAGIEASKKSDYYSHKAAAVGTGGISSDDPQALDKLREQLAQLSKTQETMKAVNAIFRKHKEPEAREAAMRAYGLADNVITNILAPNRSLRAGRAGFASYELSNNSANMRRIEKRIEQLGLLQTRVSNDFTCEAFEYKEDKEENRVMFIFPGKPEKDVRELLSKNAFKWSPTRQAWVRMLTSAGIYAGKQVIKELTKAKTDGVQQAETDKGV